MMSLLFLYIMEARELSQPFGRLDWWLHGLGGFSLTMLACLFFRFRQKEPGLSYVGVSAFIVATLHEVSHLFDGNRDFELNDIHAQNMGIVVGLAVLHLLNKIPLSKK